MVKQNIVGLSLKGLPYPILLSHVYIYTNATSYFFSINDNQRNCPRKSEDGIGIESTLRYTKEAVWSFVTAHCPSFRKENCCVQFSEVFLSLLFKTLTAYDGLLSQTSCVHREICRSCNIPIDMEVKVMVSIFSAAEYPQLRINQDLLHHLIERETRHSRTRQCLNCSALHV